MTQTYIPNMIFRRTKTCLEPTLSCFAKRWNQGMPPEPLPLRRQSSTRDRHRTSLRSCCRLHLNCLSEPQQLGVCWEWRYPNYGHFTRFCGNFIWFFMAVLYDCIPISTIVNGIMRINQQLNEVRMFRPTRVGNDASWFYHLLTVATPGPCSTTISRPPNPNHLRTKHPLW